MSKDRTKINLNRYNELMAEYQYKTLQHIADKEERARLLQAFNDQFVITHNKDLPTKEEEKNCQRVIVQR